MSLAKKLLLQLEKNYQPITMRLKTSEPFQESENGKTPTCNSSNRTAFIAQVAYWIIIISAAILAITALAVQRGCSALEDEQPAVAKQVANILSHPPGLEEESRMIKFLIPVVTATKKSPAIIPQSRVLVEVNTSQVISCESFGDEPLSSCLWGRTINGQRQVITVDEHVVEDGGRTEVDGITHDGNGLEDGKCSIKIESVSEDDAGSWSCTLVSHTGSVYMYELADYYGEENLKKHCEEELKRLITTENFSTVYANSIQFNAQILRATALDFAVPNFNDVVKSEGYKKMPDELKNRLIQELADEDAFVGMIKKPRFK